MTALRILVVAGMLAVAGCGRQADLKPAPGQPMPVKPMMARATPTVSIGEPVRITIPNMQTSHFSIVDVQGNIASVTLATGEGTFPGAPGCFDLP